MEIKVGSFSFAIRRHAGFFNVPRHEKKEFNQRHFHMFLQDLTVRVAPFAARNADSESPVFLLDADQDNVLRAHECLAGIDPHENDHRQTDDIDDLVRHISERLPWTGRFVVDLREMPSRGLDGNRSRECYDLWLPRIGRYFMQVALVVERRTAAIHVGFVPRAQTFEVEIPKELGGPWAYRRMVRRLDRFDPLGPRYWRGDLDSQSAKSVDWQQDHTKYRRRALAYRDWVSRIWGWNGRDTSTEYKTEFFSVLRYLKMHRACAILRQAIVNSIESVFVANRVRARVKMAGLRTAAEIENTIDKLERGAISLGAAYKEIGVP